MVNDKLSNDGLVQGSLSRWQQARMWNHEYRQANCPPIAEQFLMSCHMRPHISEVNISVSPALVIFRGRGLAFHP
jgi:hypothetical protein